MRVLGRVALGVAAVGGVAAEIVAGLPPGLAWLDLAAGWALLATALLADGLDAPYRALVGVAGGAWFAGTVVDDVGSAYSAPLIAVLLLAPQGWHGSAGAARSVVVAGCVRGAIPVLAASDAGTLAIGAGLAGVGGAERRPAAVVFGAGLAAAAGIRTVGGSAEAATALGSVAVIASSALLVRAARRSAGTGAVTRLIVDLGRMRDARSLERRLADALEDPGLELRYRLGAGGAWVDVAGREVPAPKLTATLVEAEGGMAAALVHDPEALRDPELRLAVVHAVRLAVLRLGRAAEAAALGDELEASRRRLLATSARERQRFAGEVAAGPGALLAEAAVALDAAAGVASAEVAPLLGVARSDLATTRSELTSAVERGVTEGLRDRGLAGALLELGERAGAVTDVRLAGLDVNADAVAALWFCASEALANALKHAGPASVALNAGVIDGALVLEVVDDGRGGTDPDGRGLVSLRSRAERVGGSLTVQSPPGGGTRVAVSVPVARDGRSTGSPPRR